MNENTLMFQVAIADVQAELNKQKKAIEKWVDGNPIRLKISSDGLEQQLRAMGVAFGNENTEVKRLREELAGLKKDLEAALNSKNSKGAGNIISATTEETKKLGEAAKQSGHDQAEAIITTTRLGERYQRLLYQIESQMRSTWQTSRGFASNAGYVPGELYKEFRELASLRKDVRSMSGSEDKDILGVLSARFSRIKSQYKDMRFDADKFNKSHDKASESVKKLTAEEERLAQAMKKSSSEMRSQSQLLSELKQYAFQYLSVWGASNFIDKIIETGGLLEQQRLSLSAILGDMEKANTLFGQVKELALKSPFGVVQIDQMTKQLAAYSFEYEELFDWTKRLADISAATGTSVDRLALALGHVRSEGALSGYTLRQFAMANVPVLRMLSENLGISSKEVRERVRKKEIGADDVQQILKQLTDEGGMFYNAQEVMSQALNAKFKNLRDAFDIMYGEIAESGVGDRLKDLATILTQGAKEWERFGRDILMVGTAFGIGKVAIALYNTALGQNTTSTLKNIAAAQQKENAHLRLARAAGMVTNAEYKQLIYNERYSASGLKVALVENKLTVEELQRAVALGKVNKAVAQAAVVAAGYDAALISNVKVLGFWRKGIFLLGEGFRAAGVAAKGFLASVWPLLALSAVFDLVNRTSQNNDAAKESAQSAAKATNKYQDLQAMTERLGSSQNKTTDQLENNIKAMKESLIATGKYTEELKKQVDSVETLAEKYDILHAAMKRVSDEANDKQSRKQALIEEGLSAGSGTAWLPWNWFRDNALKDAKDIDDYAGDLYLALDKNDRVLRDGFKKILETRNEWQKKFESMSAKDIFMSLDEDLQDDVLYLLRWGIDSSKEMQKAGTAVASVMYGGRELVLKEAIGYSYKGAFAELENHKEELAKAFADAFRVDYPEIDLSKASPDQKIVFAKWLDETIANLEDVKESGKKALNDIVIRGTIKVRPDYSLDNENWEKFLNDFKEKNPLAYNEWNRHENIGALTEEEKRKSLESYGKTFSGATQNNIGNQAKKQIKELKEERARLVAFEDSIVYKDSKEEQQRTEKRKGEIDEQIKRLKQAQKDYNQYGDPDKNKNKEDKEAKTLRERVRILKEAADSYKYWKKAVGEGNAFSHVNDEFGGILGEQGFKIEDAKNLEGTLTELREKYIQIYEASGKKRPKLLEAIKEIDKELAQLDRFDFEQKVEKFVSQMTFELDKLSRAFDIFNSVREATGDTVLAQRLTGISPGATPADLKRYYISSSAGKAIDFESVLGMSDDDIDRYVESLGVVEENIQAIQNALKDWKKAEQDVYKSDIQNYAKWLGSLVDLETKRKKNLEEYERVVEETNRLMNRYKATNGKEGITEAEGSRRITNAGVVFEKKNWEDTEIYKRLYSNALGMAQDEFSAAYRKEMENLKAQMNSGIITFTEYNDKVNKLQEIQREFNNQGFLGIKGGVGNFLSGGISGLIGYYRKRQKDAADDNNEEESERYKKMADKLEQVTKAADQLVQAFNDISLGADMVAGMFDSLGMEGEANALSDAAGVVGGIGKGAAALSSLGPWGMAAGAMIGGISSIAQLNDKKHERRIEELRKEVTKIDNTLKTIKSLRERELGYDTGVLRKQLADQYQSQTKNRTMKIGHQTITIDMTPAMSGMAEFYGRYSGGNGYSQELNAMKATRKNYMEMYEEENAKKKKSKDALEEYKQKIAELDEQIMYFAQDLAKELWGIDIKGWANQISDAIWTAFENGEDAVKAFGDTAKSIVSSVAKNMMLLSIIEPMFQQLQKELFGTYNQQTMRYEGGKIKYDSNGTIDVQGSEQGVLEVLGRYFGEGGSLEKNVEAAEMFYKWVEKITGMDLSSDENKTGVSTSIKNITESTGDLLASYINATRASVSKIERMDAEYYPMYLQLITSCNLALTTLQTRAKEIADSNAAIERNTKTMADLMSGLKNKTWRVPIA